MPYKNPADKRAWQQRRQQQPAEKERQRIYQEALRRDDPEKTRARVRLSDRKRMGIKEATGETRHGPCPICSTNTQLVCDHDHETGLIRGWICKVCNRGLGHFGDNLAGLDRAREYLLAARSK